jgi:hypothetical protein
LGLFGLATVLATFQKILGDFFPNHLVTLVTTKEQFTLMTLATNPMPTTAMVASLPWALSLY